MNKGTKKILSASMLILLAIIFASCDLINKGSDVSTTQPITADPSASNLTDLGKFVSVVPKKGDIDYTAGNEVAKQKIINTIATDKGVKLDFEVIEISENDFTNELNQLLSSSTYIDSITADIGNLPTYADLPLIKPIDDLLATYAPNLYNAIDQEYWDEVTYNGHIYGIPSLPYPEETLIVTRQDLSSLFTTEPIDSYASFIALCNFYKTKGYEYPVAVTWEQFFDATAQYFAVTAAPYTYIAGNNTFVMREQRESYKKYFLEEMKHMYDLGFFNPSLFTASEEQMKADFMAGKSAIYISEYSDLIADRQQLKSTFPNAELQIVFPLSTRYINKSLLSGEKKVDKVLMFTANSQNTEALLTFLDWSYTSQLNHTMTQLGAYGEQLMYNPAANEYEYINNYSLENKPYDGLYTLGLSTDMLFTLPSYVEYTLDISAINKLNRDAIKVMTETPVNYPISVPLSDTAKQALNEYGQTERTAAELYITGQINIDEYNQYQYQIRNSGLLDILYQEIGIPYMKKIGVLDSSNPGE